MIRFVITELVQIIIFVITEIVWIIIFSIQNSFGNLICNYRAYPDN